MSIFNLVHLAAFVLASHPRSVRAAIERHAAGVTPYAQLYLRVGPSIVTSEGDIDKALSALRRFV